MSSEFDSGEEPKDRSKWIWAGIAVTLAVMTLILARWGRMNPKASVVHARHILITFNQNDPLDRGRAMDLITGLRERIVAGEDFGGLARQYSNDPWSSQRGGDLGYAFRGEYEQAFEALVWTVPVGQVSDIIQTTKGFHLAEVVYRHVSEIDRHETMLLLKILEEVQEGAMPPGDTLQ